MIIENRKFETGAFEGDVDAASVEKRLLELGCPPKLAKKSAQGAEMRCKNDERLDVCLPTAAQIDADHRRRAAALAVIIANDKV